MPAVTTNTNPNPAATHSMVTRYRVGTNRPTQRYTLNVSTISPIPKSYSNAFRDPNWYRAMLDEYNALIKNNTWVLVPRPSDANIVLSLWLFRHKHNADGSLNRYKARLVANGSIQIFISWMSRIFYLCLPNESLLFLDLVRRQSIGVLPMQWPRLASCAIFYVSFLGPGFSDLQPMLLELVFLTQSLLQRIIASLYAEFSMTDLGPLNYFLGVFVTRNTSRMFLSQQNLSILHSIARLAGALQYLTFTRPDISYVVQQVCLFMHDPREPHFSALKRILRYVCGTLTSGLQLYSSTTSSLVAYFSMRLGLDVVPLQGALLSWY
ncbi:ribonuclease H-like domain-containing protein [Tanacetum coccineum]